MSRWLLTLVLLLSVVLLAPAASADNKALAETLFLDGKAMLSQGKLEEACKRFQASHQAEASVGAILNLARCHEKLGKLASAWSNFREAASLAERMNQPGRKKGALEYAALIEPRISKLTVNVVAPVEGLVVSLDGDVLAPGSFGAALPLDPGMHELTATAPDHKPWAKEVNIGPERDLQTIDIPALTVVDTQPEPVAVPSEGMHARAVAGLVIAGVGVASLVAGVVLGVVAINAEADLKDQGCEEGTMLCTALGKQKVDDIKPIADASTATIVIGAAALLGGGILFLTAPSMEAAQSAVRVYPMVSPDLQGVGIVGVF